MCTKQRVLTNLDLVGFLVACARVCLLEGDLLVVGGAVGHFYGKYSLVSAANRSPGSELREGWNMPLCKLVFRCTPDWIRSDKSNTVTYQREAFVLQLFLSVLSDVVRTRFVVPFFPLGRGAALVVLVLPVVAIRC